MTPARRSSAPTLLLCLGLALLSLAPLLLHLADFRRLFYFQDEWDLIDQWNKTGLGHWIAATFAENFVPLFKALWAGTIIAGGGSYFLLLALLWLNHALNTFIVARLCLRCGAGPGGTAIATAVFGVSWVNFETLTWTVQWSAVLSLTFFLLGADWLARESKAGTTPGAGRTGLVLGLCTLASALCFSRGVLTGVAFAIWVALTPAFAGRPRARALVAALSLFPAIAIAWWIFQHSNGNHHHLGTAAGSMFAFALYYYAQSPLRTLWSNETPGLLPILLLALAKTAIFLAGVRLAPARARAVLVAIVAFEVGNALLLGLGRYHTGLPASGSSRYQYGAIAALTPFVALCLGALLRPIPAAYRLRALVVVALFVATGWLSERPWTALLQDWVPGRGGELRRAMFDTPPAAAPANFTGVPWIPNDRARALAELYRLH